MNQDFMAALGQGKISDRTSETLGASDAGIVMLRHRFDRDLRQFELNRGDPKAVIRDESLNRHIRLPVADRDQLIGGQTIDQMLGDPFVRERLRGFIFQSGQPQSVRDAFVDAMGIGNLVIQDLGQVDLLARMGVSDARPGRD